MTRPAVPDRKSGDVQVVPLPTQEGEGDADGRGTGQRLRPPSRGPTRPPSEEDEAIVERVVGLLGSLCDDRERLVNEDIACSRSRAMEPSLGPAGDLGRPTMGEATISAVDFDPRSGLEEIYLFDVKVRFVLDLLRTDPSGALAKVIALQEDEAALAAGSAGGLTDDAPASHRIPDERARGNPEDVPTSVGGVDRSVDRMAEVSHFLTHGRKILAGTQAALDCLRVLSLGRAP